MGALTAPGVAVNVPPRTEPSMSARASSDAPPNKWLMNQRGNWGVMSKGIRHKFVIAIAVVSLSGGACSSSNKNANKGASTASTTGGGGATTTTYDTSKNTASDVGVTPTQITLGNVATLTGPIPGLFAGAPAATDAFFQYINSQGGVFG